MVEDGGLFDAQLRYISTLVDLAESSELDGAIAGQIVEECFSINDKLTLTTTAISTTSGLSTLKGHIRNLQRKIDSLNED